MSDFEKVLSDLSKSHQPSGYKCEAVKGKTPDQIKHLAHHYYSRARHAEKRERVALEALRSAVAEVQRLQCLAYEMTEGRA